MKRWYVVKVKRANENKTKIGRRSVEVVALRHATLELDELIVCARAFGRPLAIGELDLNRVGDSSSLHTYTKAHFAESAMGISAGLGGDFESRLGHV